MPTGKNTQVPDYHLKFGKGPEETGIPYLPPYYAYLLLLDADVGLVDVYPWLAELLFYSLAVRSHKRKQEFGPANMIAFFIDDHRNNIANTMLSEPEDDAFVVYKRVATRDRKNANRKYPPRHFVVDTFAEFGAPSANPLKSEKIKTYSLVGAGNPMQMMRIFTEIGSESDTDGVKKEDTLGVLNCVVINSISNLYRTMGLRDAMLLIRAMLERAVWKPTEKPMPEDNQLLSKVGMLFAVLHDGVFKTEEIQYARTFFDGIIRFEGHYEKGQRQIGYSIQNFPGLRRSKKERKGFEIEFDVPRWYEPLAGQRMEIVGKGKKIKEPNSDDKKNEQKKN